MEQAPTLICIPDISGFTEFMSKVDFELGAKVIPSLLNTVIYSNEIGLKVSEIEGDAVLFFRQGELPTLGALIDQCKKFYSEFYVHLSKLRDKYSSSEHAGMIPTVLGLKIILHYGPEVAPVPVDKHIKLIGEDVIVAHRLLKNSIAIDEYILISKNLMAQYVRNLEKEVNWTEIQEGYITDRHIGRIPFHFIPLKAML